MPDFTTLSPQQVIDFQHIKSPHLALGRIIQLSIENRPMKHSKDNIRVLEIGQECFEQLFSDITMKHYLIYDYRMPSGVLFSIVITSESGIGLLTLAREKRDNWMRIFDPLPEPK